MIPSGASCTFKVPSTGSITIDLPLLSWMKKCAPATSPCGLPSPGAGVGTTTIDFTPSFTSSTVAKLASTHMPNSCGAMACMAFSGVTSVYLA